LIRNGVTGAKPRATGRLGGLAAAADELGEGWHGGSAGDAEPDAEVIPEGNAKLAAGLAKAEEGVAAVATGVCGSAPQ
jgi:hypothetical protein